MTDREAMLAGLRASPLDDTGRLIYADWLFEHGAEPVREEFIRMACRFKEVKSIPPREGKFLDAHYKELLPATYAMGRFARDAGFNTATDGWRRVLYTRSGRHVRLSFSLQRGDGTGYRPWRRHWVGFWYLRGFAYRVTYYGAEHFDRLCGVAAMDEPLAEHAMHDRLSAGWVQLAPDDRRVRLAVDVYYHMVGSAFPLIEGADVVRPGYKRFVGDAIFDSVGHCNPANTGYRMAESAVVKRATDAVTAAMTRYATTKVAAEAVRAVDTSDGGSTIGETESHGEPVDAVQG